MTDRVHQRRLSALLILTMLCLLLTAVPSFAHALLVRSVPEAGAELTAAPATIDLWFSEPLESRFSNVHLVDALGTEIAVGDSTVATADPTQMTLPLAPLAPGIYTVVWRTLSSADGHEWVGSFPITILNADGSQPSIAGVTAVAGPSQSTLPTPVETAVRWLSLMGGLLLFGVAAFRLWVIDRTVVADRDLQKRIARNSDLALLTGMVALISGGWQQIVVQADHLGDAGMVGTLLLHTRLGNLILVRQIVVGILLIGGIGLRQWQPRGKPLIAVRTEEWLTLLLSLLVLGTFSLGSHAAAVAGSGWTILVDLIHLVAAAIWLGGLWLLAVLFWQHRRLIAGDNGAAAAGGMHRQLAQRFSLIATLSVFILVITGLFSSLVQLKTPSQLWTSTYGQVLLVKVGLVVIALLLALRNHQWVRDPKVATESSMTPRNRAFLRQIGAESMVGLLLMVVVAVLVQTPPQLAPAAPPAAASILNTILTADDLTIHLQIAPNQVGNNRYITHLYHTDGSTIGEVQLVRLQFNHQTADLGQATLELAAHGQDSFMGKGAYLNRAGPWDIAVYVRRRAMDDLLATTTVAVPSPTTTRPASTQSLWQNPLPQIPPVLIIGGSVMGILLFLLLWRYAVAPKR